MPGSPGGSTVSGGGCVLITPVHDEKGVTIYWSHSVFVLMGMPSNSVDSIVTDPPYGLSFMGKKWDYDVPSVQLWRETLRVLKPGGHMLAFGGSRTYHRMVVNIEDAGFEIRDQIMWLYGSGFPKSLDVSKAIDKAAGAEREVIGKHPEPAKSIYSQGNNEMSSDVNITAPAPEEAKQWDGWGTALKPAHEPICVARKPPIGTVAENVLKHGTGGLNIDACRIEGPPWKWGTQPDLTGGGYGTKRVSDGYIHAKNIESNPKGRFPANLILDPEAGAMLDRQSGDCPTGDLTGQPRTENKIYGSAASTLGTPRYHQGDSGGASRFFYCAKASKEDRDEGLELMKLKKAGGMSGRHDGSMGSITMSRNHHPTVKPTALMQYLVRLVTPPGGTVLDPFMGSGSTGKGAVRENFKFIGIERDGEYIPLAIARINAPAQVELI